MVSINLNINCRAGKSNLVNINFIDRSISSPVGNIAGIYQLWRIKQQQWECNCTCTSTDQQQQCQHPHFKWGISPGSADRCFDGEKCKRKQWQQDDKEAANMP